MMPLIAKDTPAREAFAVLLAARKAMRYPGRDHPVQQEFGAAVVSAARSKHPKKRNVTPERAAKLLTDEEYAAIRAPFQERADALGRQHFDTLKRIKTAMHSLAELATIDVGETEFVLFERSSCDYSTQGFGASSYARNRCQLEALNARGNGIAAEVRERKDKERRVDGPWSAGPIQFFEVVVKLASELDLEILRCKPSLPLREQVRLCWKLGANPRVFIQWLDHDYETRVGLDFFGNEKPRVA